MGKKVVEEVITVDEGEKEYSKESCPVCGSDIWKVKGTEGMLTCPTCGTQSPPRFP